ncbi:MAG: TonB-dependent receptor [Muribaculaceae bacterium]|nr:TonB-dependent receptor [Muribaculaceae bacterium]
MKSLSLGFSIAILGTSLSVAQNVNDTVSLSELLVTAPVKVEVALTPMDVTVVSSEQIEKSTESSLLPILQNHVPGLFVSERGMEGYGVSGGSAGTVNIRGVGSGNKVLFMIDGMPQWAGMFGHSNADTYVANGVERVEVVKGPSSILYGSNAMAGSVNIITKRQRQDGFTGKARAMFGSYYTSKFNLMTGFKKDKFSAVVAGQLDRSNNNRPGSDFWLANEYIQLQYSASSHWNVGTNVDMTQSTANNPGTIQDPLENMWTNIFRGTAQLYANNHYDKVHGGVQAYINWGKHKLDDGNTPGTPEKNYLFNLTDYNMGFALFETINPWIDNDLSVGLDFQHWGGHIWNTPKENVYDPETDGAFNPSEAWHHENEVAGYLIMQQGFLHNILSLNAGVRLQHNSQYGNIWVPQAGFIIRPVQQSEIKFSFSKGFRSPNIRELYLYRPANSDLKPEYMLNYELSYRQTVCEGKLNYGAALYFIDGKDMIQTQMIDGSPMNVNTGKFKNKGFELDATWHFHSKWQLYAGYAYLHTDNKNVLYAPKNKLDISLAFSPDNFEFNLENSNIWSLNNGNPDSTVSYSLFNFRAAYTYPYKVPVTFFVKLDNIFNKKYEVVYGCPMPGITVMGGVELKF